MKNAFLSIALAVTISQVGFSQVASTLTVDGTNPRITISRHIYGHFSEHLGRCIYDGFWVGDSITVPKKDRIRLDIVDALKKIKVPNLRWPGGCFADEYHWRDGIGPRNQRPHMVNTNWGGVSEDNSFGTHEFLELCSLIGCDPYIAGNVGSGTVEEMAKWVEYLNSNASSTMTELRKQNCRAEPWHVKFWGVGNESWGCGGNMTPDYYAGEYKRYATYARNYPDAPLFRIASGANSSDYNWTDVLMKNAGNHMWGLTLHHYTIPTGSWGKKGSATSFDEKEYHNTMQNCLFMEELVIRHSTIMDRYDPAKRVALAVDEWGIWTDVEPGTNPGFLYQQNSLRDALVAGTTLNIFNNHCDRVRMANLAQTINVLQALILTKGNQLLLTPTYHVFDLYKVHMDAKWLPVNFNSPDYIVDNKKISAVNISASQDSITGAVHISLVNLDPGKKIPIRTNLVGIKWQTVQGQILTSKKLTDINSFENPSNIKIMTFNNAKKEGDALVLDLPPQSIVVLELK